jgi:NAD(P)-dependent dehydrogenase (short-subunit alcohol dehydrogenase family)
VVIEVRRGGLGPYDLAGRVAVIAGGSGGIGSATARRLADAGATVVVGHHRGRQRAADLAASLPGEGHAALRISVDDTPLRVLVHPDDVAVAIIGAVTHLRLATGTVITVDGGKHL